MKMWKIKKYMAVLLGLFFLIPLVAYGASIDLGTVSGAPGSTVTIPIILNYSQGETPNICSIGIDIGFDPDVLENPQVEIGPAGSNADKQVFSILVEDGLFRIGIAGMNQNIISAGVVANVSFTIKAEIPEGCTILTNNPNASDPDGNPISVIGEDGKVCGHTSVNHPPIIDSFTADPTSGNAPLTVTFTCQAHDPDGTIASYKWDFDGDGMVDQSTTDGSATYTYDSEGSYQAKVTVVDNEGASVTSNTIAITVGSNLPPGTGFYTANPPTPMDPVAYGSGTFPRPSDTPVSVAPGMVSIAPMMNIPDCNDVVQPLMYVYLPQYELGINLSSLVEETCDSGIATFALPDIDMSNYPELIFDIYYGYVDDVGRIFYNTYEVTVSDVPQCSGLDQETCQNTVGCVWNPFPQGQCSLDCGQYTVQADCEAAYAGSCRWQSTMWGGVCVEK